MIGIAGLAAQHFLLLRFVMNRQLDKTMSLQLSNSKGLKEFILFNQA